MEINIKMNKTKIILRNDVAKKRKKLGKGKDLFDNIDDSMMYEFEMAFNTIKDHKEMVDNKKNNA